MKEESSKRGLKTMMCENTVLLFFYIFYVCQRHPNI